MTALSWRNQPVFISSTFRDMHLERDHLWRFVFPWLGEFLSQRRMHLEPIDLRWGINSEDLEHAELKEKHILRVCLNEITRSQPFIIVLVGKRYGWVPPQPLAQKVFHEMGFPEHDVEGKSVTHLEIDYGIFNSEKVIPYFYIEQDLGCEDDSHNDAEDLVQADRTRQLKDLIMRRFADRVRHYSRSDLPGFGELVKEDLKREFTAAFPLEVTDPSNEREQADRYEIERFVERRYRRAVMGRALSEKLANTSHWCSMLLGAPGSGRSTVFALIHQLVSQHPDRILLAHSFGVTASGGSTEAMLTRWVSMLERRLQDASLTKAQISRLPLVEKFWQLMQETARKESVMILVDGIEQAGESALGQYLGWIPPTPIEGVTVVLFDLVNGERQARLQRRFEVQCFVLESMNVHQAQDLIDNLCLTYHRVLPREIIEMLLAKNGPEGNRCSSNPLWLTLATEELNLIEASEYLQTDQRYPHLSPEERVSAMLRDTVMGLADDVRGLYARKFEKLEEVLDQALVRTAIGGVALSDVGLAEHDILSVVQTNIDSGISSLDIVNIRLLLHGDLTQGRFGHWRFEHALARDAFLARLALEGQHEDTVKPSDSRLGIARAYWKHFRNVGDVLSETRFACVEDPSALMMYHSFAKLDDLESSYLDVVAAYGCLPAWYSRALGECFVDLWDDEWWMQLYSRVEDWKVIDEIASLLWDVSQLAHGELKSFRKQFLECIEMYEKTTQVMMQDFDDKGLWKTIFTNRLRVCALVESGKWDQAYRTSMNFLGQLNRYGTIDDEELFLVCLLAAVVPPEADKAPVAINGNLEDRNIVAARSILLAIRELRGQDCQVAMLELGQKYPASIALNIYNTLYMDHYSPETDAHAIGFLVWQARVQKISFRDCQPLNWLEVQTHDR